MALVFDAPVSPDALTTFVRLVPTPSDQVLNTLLPDRVLDRNTVDFSEFTQLNRTAKFRAYDARLHVTDRDANAVKQVKLPALSSSISVGEFERLQMEMSKYGGTNQSLIVNAIYDDATNLTREIYARMEMARGDVLTDGKFTLAGEGNLTMEADFGVPGNHIVAPVVPWSTTATATIIADITAWVNVYIATNGSRPSGILVSTRVMNYMLQNAEIRALSASLSGAPGLVTRPAVDAWFAAFGLPPITVVYYTVMDVDGVTTKVIPDDRFIMYGENVGFTAWGVSATALELVNSAEADLSFASAPGVCGVVIKEGPPFRQFTYVDAVGMPILENPKRLLIADVA